MQFVVDATEWKIFTRSRASSHDACLAGVGGSITTGSQQSYILECWEWCGSKCQRQTSRDSLTHRAIIPLGIYPFNLPSFDGLNSKVSGSIEKKRCIRKLELFSFDEGDRVYHYPLAEDRQTVCRDTIARDVSFQGQVGGKSERLKKQSFWTIFALDLQQQSLWNYSFSGRVKKRIYEGLELLLLRLSTLKTSIGGGGARHSPRPRAPE